MESFEGQIVVVTGAGQGIGRALATKFAEAGAHVVVNDLNADTAAAVATDIGGVPVAGDAASEPGVTALHTAAVEQFGRVDVWVANAGIERGLGLSAPDDDWYQSLEVNLMAHIRAARLLVARATGGPGRRGETVARGIVPASAPRHQPGRL